MADWFELIGVGLSSGITVKIIDYIYKEFRRSSDSKKTAKDLINKHIDPILKSADELVGKIGSLAKSDFVNLAKNSNPKENNFESWMPYLSILYLFAQFWARVQILRIESLFVNLGSDIRGKQLQAFFRALESTRTRLVDRSWQRGMGEVIIDHSGSDVRILTFNEFVDKFLASEDLKKWYNPLNHFLTHSNHKKYRQRVLNYGVILQALTDSLDNNHLVTHKRPSWPNKLSIKSRRNLQYRVFKVYLPFVKNPTRYYKIRKTDRGVSAQ